MTIHEGPFHSEEKLTPYPHNESKPEWGRATDPVGYLQAVEQRARERQIAIETLRIIRTRVQECYRREGVNHYENCQKEVKDYYDIIMLKSLGQVQPDWADERKKEGFGGFFSVAKDPPAKKEAK